MKTTPTNAAKKTKPRRKRECFAALIALFSTAALVVTFKSWSFSTDQGGVRGLVGALDKPEGSARDGGAPFPTPSPTPRAEPRRVAVCFFGLTRSLRWTLPSIEKRLLGVLRDSGMEVDTFVHTYHLLEVNNHRAGEMGIEYDEFKDDFHALNATRSSVTDQDLFDKTWPDPLSMTRYHWNYKENEIHSLISNVFRAYWSMSTSWSLLVQHAMETGTRYDAVVLARPDVWFHIDTDLPRREFPLPERTVFLPSFECSKGEGGRKNDRFAYGSMAAMGVVMNRIATLTDPTAGQFTGQIDSEWVMGHHLMVNNIAVETMEFSVTRVRLTGGIPLFDHKRVKIACQSGGDPMACEMVETIDYSVTRVRLTGDIPLLDHKRVQKACQSGEDPMACEMVDLDFKFPMEH